MVDTKRDAAADLAVCAAATPGPWAESFRRYTIDVFQSGGEHIANFHWNEPSTLHSSREKDAIFTAMTRTALPHWIERATAAEEKLAHLADMVTDYQAIGTDVERLQARLVEASEARYDWEAKAKAAEAEVERLRQCDSNALRCLGEQMKIADELLSGCHDAYSALTRGVVGMERLRAVAALGAVINEAMKAKGGAS